MTLTFGSLFAGIGGFDEGLRRAGMIDRFQVEIDPTCRTVLARHFPESRRHDDVTTVRGDGLPHSDAENGILGVQIECPGGVSPPQGASPELEVQMRENSTPSRLGFHYKKLSPEQAVEAVAIYDGGASIGQVAEHFGVTRQGMWDLLRRRTTMRPQQRRGEDKHFYRGGVHSDPEAHDLTERAIAEGGLVRPEGCDVCGHGGTAKDGRAIIQAHHDDDNKPLDVRWLCQPCHHEWHKHNTPIRKEVQAELSPVDVITAGFP